MKIDRLKKDSEEVINLEDIIHAHSERTSHISTDIDSLEEDLDIPEDIDVDDALTFPHPKHEKTIEVDLMGTPHKEDIEQTWKPSDQDIQPTDYEDHYEAAIDTYATDDLDGVCQDQVHDLGEMTPHDVVDEPTTEILPDKFTPDEETEAGS